MKHLLLLIFFFNNMLFAQDSIDKVLKQYNKQSIPYIQVEALKQKTSVVLLDARELIEFNVSHIANAIAVGHMQFDASKVVSVVTDKNACIVVYCSIGVRSEQIAEKIMKLGYTNVLNLYGGIFEWKNKGNDVVDTTNKKTEKVHTYSKKWSAYLKNGDKVY